MNVYEIVNEKIGALLEQGTVPWRKPWTSTAAPMNLISRKPYRGINHFLLCASGYVSPYWLTIRQANELGGRIRKGEHGTLVVFWKISDRSQDETPLDPAEESQPRRRFILRYYLVWNVAQCELPQRVLDTLPKVETHQHNPIEVAEHLIAGMPHAPKIEHTGAKAFYSPASDTVTLPPRNSFSTPENYYATAFHELTHSTGHPSRLAREAVAEVAPFGSSVYSREELVAEMGAAYLCAKAGISPAVIENQAAYIAGWLSTLRADSRLVVYAAAHAQKAIDYIVGAGPEESDIE